MLSNAEGIQWMSITLNQTPHLHWKKHMILHLFSSPASACPILPVFTVFPSQWPFFFASNRQIIPTLKPLHKLSPMAGVMFPEIFTCLMLYHILHFRSNSTSPSSEASALIISTGTLIHYPVLFSLYHVSLINTLFAYLGIFVVPKNTSCMRIGSMSLSYTDLYPAAIE